MSKSFTRTGGLAGLLGSILVLGSMVFGILVPNTQIPSAPFYGLGALLLLVNVVSSFLLQKGRPEWLANLSLAAATLGLVAIVLYAFLDTLANMGIGSTDGYWAWLMVALLLTILGISAYIVTALAARALPAWIALPFACSGMAMVLLALVASTGLINPGSSSSAETFVSVASKVLMLTFFAMWGLMAIVDLRNSSVEMPTPSDLVPGSGIPT